MRGGHAPPVKMVVGGVSLRRVCGRGRLEWTLDMLAVSGDGNNKSTNLLLVHCLASSVSVGQAPSPRGPPDSHENLHVVEDLGI